MDEDKLNLKGSPSRDSFKHKHKNKEWRKHYACDLDLVLVMKDPTAHILAFLDYKIWGDKVTFSEVIAYNQLQQQAPVYIIRGDKDCEGPFYISLYVNGDYRPDPPDVFLLDEAKCSNWDELYRWEAALRAEAMRPQQATGRTMP